MYRFSLHVFLLRTSVTEETGKQFILLVRSSQKYLCPKLIETTSVYKMF